MISVQEENGEVKKMSKVGKELIQGLNECLEYEQGKRHDLRTFAEVVFCKDCKYWHEHYIADSKCCWYWIAWSTACIMPTEADDFCSRGEKKDE